jgi:hypothetical protein
MFLFLLKTGTPNAVRRFSRSLAETAPGCTAAPEDRRAA